MTKKEEQKKPRCENCGSTQTYLRLKTDERYCRNCGHVQKIREGDHGNNR